MNIYVISDNSFFLNGFAGVGYFRRQSLLFILCRDVDEDFIPGADDLIVLYITDVRERFRISRLPALRQCRTVMLLKMTVQKNHFSYITMFFPWLLPHNISPEVLCSYLIAAVNAPFRYKCFPWNEVRIFNCLGEGYAAVCLCPRELSEKYAYRLKRQVIMKLGLIGNSATTVMACRDIMALSEVRESACIPEICSLQ